ncbi:MAG: class I SAM-dependent methyltransferase [Saprospiraceae bacterium]|nr:class I SAM-dependent methyltransferase [Saprospiraceae bacterium]MCB9324814.1 class I SAM-dependent methyltransferase [Lewinellaceae bacterium]
MRFDEAAKTWDDSPERTERSVLFAERLSEMISANGYRTGMDFGAGTGVTSFMLAETMDSIILIDYSIGMVEQINRKLREREVNNLQAHCIDLLDPGVSLPGPFDIIYSIMTLHHIHNTENLLDIFHQCLNPGGMIVLVDLDEEDGSFHSKYPDFDGHRGFDRMDLGLKIQKAGFRSVESDDFFTIIKETEGGASRAYPLFLISAKK